MSEQTKIAWCDSTVNFWEGCTKVSAGCANCYAEARDKRFTGGKLWGKGAPRRKSKSAVKDALAYNRKPMICEYCNNATNEDGKNCTGCGRTIWHRRRIFSLSLGDWLDNEVPIEWLAEMLDTIRQCDQVTWILCTKRPENWRARLEGVLLYLDNKKPAKKDDTLWGFIYEWLNGGDSNIEGERSACPPRNIIMLTSVENQEQADKRIPELLKIPAACRGLSLEPLLGEVKLPTVVKFNSGNRWIGNQDTEIDWLIIGGESGPNARPCNVDWIRSLVEQGKAAGVATFVKQLGAKPEKYVMPLSYEETECPVGIDLRDKKGGDPAEWPADLCVQEWPKL